MKFLGQLEDKYCFTFIAFWNQNQIKQDYLYKGKTLNDPLPSKVYGAVIK